LCNLLIISCLIFKSTHFQIIYSVNFKVFTTIGKVTGKIVLYALLGMVIILFFTAMALQIPSIQTQVAKRATVYLSQKLRMKVEVDGVDIRWFDALTLKGVRLFDHHNEAMIKVEKLAVDFKLSHLTDSTRISLDHVYLFHPNVQLIQYAGEKQFNIDELIDSIDNLLASPTPTKKKSKSIPFVIDMAEVEDGTFGLDYRADPYMREKKVFDYNHFTLDKINGTAKQFTIQGDTLSLYANNLFCLDRRADLTVKHLDTYFEYSKRRMLFDKLYAYINNSVVKNHVEFQYQSMKDMTDFNRKVNMIARFDSSVIDAHDLARFAPAMYGFNDKYILYGDFLGKVVDFAVKNTQLAFGKQSRLKGDFAFKGLPDVDKMLMNFQMNHTVVAPADLHQYVGENTLKPLEKLGKVVFNGTFKGLYNDFESKINYKTALGDAYTHIAMKIKPDLDASTYEGELSLLNFDLGKFTDNSKILQKISLSGMVKGQGFDIEKAILHIDADIDHIQFNGYQYQGIYTNGDLQKGFFDGQVKMNDPNLKTELVGKVDLRNRTERFDIEGTISKAMLKPLGLSSDDISLQSKLQLHFQGTKLDEIVGTGQFLDTYLSKDTRNLIVDSLFVYSFKPDSIRTIGIESDILEAKAQGKFNMNNAIADLSELLTEYELYFFDTEEHRQDYYQRKICYEGSPYHVDFKTTLKNTMPLMAFFYPDGYISEGTRVDGVFRKGNTSRLDIFGNVDTLQIKNYHFYNSDFEINTSKFTNTPEVLASGIINSKEQKLSILAPTDSLQIEAVWDRNQISFNGGISQIDNTNQANLEGTIRFVADSINVNLSRNAKLRLLNDEWLFNPLNVVSFKKDKIWFKNFSMFNGDQLLGVYGIVSPDSSETLRLQTAHFQLQTLAPILQTNLKGTINIAATLRDAYTNASLDGQMTVQDFMYDNFLIGNVNSESQWDKVKQQLNINANIERLGTKTLSVVGNYTPQKSKESLDLQATLNKTDLKVLESFTKGIFSDLEGYANGNVTVKGSLSQPILGGEIEVEKGKIKLDYLNTTWFFEDTIQFGESEIASRHLLVKDEDGNQAVVVGGVYHDGFEYLTLRLSAKMKNFKVLNTTAKNNNLFYGTAFATGKLEIEGPFDNLSIRANARTNKNTKIYIPLDGAQDVGSQEYIEFVSFTNPNTQTQVANAQSQTNSLASSILMDFNFDITPDATCEILFDRQSGDIIKANGNGKVNLKIDTKSDFSMTGDYTIEKGDYTFTFQNILNKRFTIEKGSSLSWTGDPYGADLNIKAAYTQPMSLYPLLDTTQAKGNEYRRRYPVSVELNLSDKLTAPRINYNLFIKEYPQLPVFNSGITAFTNKIKDDEQELSRQVSSIIVLGQLLPANPLNSFSNDNIVNNLSELISNQISQWASQIDKNLQIDINVANLNQSLINNLQLRFSYNFNDRLRITRNGGFTNAQNQTDNLSLIGDWSLEYLLTEDGKFRLKGYNRNIQNPFSSLGASTVTTTTGGASVLYTRSFNKLFGIR
jgi:TamB, inner membrane protein subunit of TAM complex